MPLSLGQILSPLQNKLQKNKELKSDGVHSVSMGKIQNYLKRWVHISAAHRVWKGVISVCCKRALQLQRTLLALIGSEYVND